MKSTEHYEHRIENVEMLRLASEVDLIRKDPELLSVGDICHIRGVRYKLIKREDLGDLRFELTFQDVDEQYSELIEEAVPEDGYYTETNTQESYFKLAMNSQLAPGTAVCENYGRCGRVLGYVNPDSTRDQELYGEAPPETGSTTQGFESECIVLFDREYSPYPNEDRGFWYLVKRKFNLSNDQETSIRGYYHDFETMEVPEGLTLESDKPKDARTYFKQSRPKMKKRSQQDMTVQGVCGRQANGRMRPQRVRLKTVLDILRANNTKFKEASGKPSSWPSADFTVQESEIAETVDKGMPFHIIDITTGKPIKPDANEQKDKGAFARKYINSDGHRLRVYAEPNKSVIVDDEAGNKVFVFESGTTDNPRVSAIYPSGTYAGTSQATVDNINEAVEKAKPIDEMKTALDLIKRTRLGISSIEPEVITNDTKKVTIKIENPRGGTETITLDIEDGDFKTKVDNYHWPSDDDDPDEPDDTNSRDMRKEWKKTFPGMELAENLPNSGMDILHTTSIPENRPDLDYGAPHSHEPNVKYMPPTPGGPKERNIESPDAKRRPPPPPTRRIERFAEFEEKVPAYLRGKL